jgi:carbon-monoxide dehydrogenase small subunit
MVEYKIRAEIVLNINNENRTIYVKTAATLLDALRAIGITSPKKGCENGDCGACTVLVDGYPVKSCLYLAVEAVGKKILSVEGLKNSPIFDAFVKKNAFQCGYCTPGFVVVCHSLAQNKPDADDAAISEWLQSNICRCTSYEEITEAVKTALESISKDKNA